jgi:tetratricopeptide (TPR) repeat protein
MKFGDPELKGSPEKVKMAGMKKALENFLLALDLREKLKDPRALATSLVQVATLYSHMGQKAKAIPYAQRALQWGEMIAYPDNIKQAAYQLYLDQKSTGDVKNALVNFELYIKMRDSIANESNKKAAIRTQLKYEYEKQAAADSVAHAKESDIKNAELAKQSAELKAKRNQQYALFGGLFCVCVFGVFMFNRYKITQRQKGIIEKQKYEVETQKMIVEEKQKEILDSIHYAKRIQLAHIPSEKRVEQIMKRLMK